ncbi:NAM domain-containing protein, partial [Cephalotus follicularis]
MGHETMAASPLALLQAAAEAAQEAATANGTTTTTTTTTAAAAPRGQAAPTALAPGFRFHPTDEELVCYYLKRKVAKKPVRFDAIGEVDIYRNEPWDLSDYSRLKTRDQEWYFYSALDKKYGNGARMNRATGRGYWKATGKDREVRREGHLIGMKKTLVFHSGRAPDGLRTNWVMHEYRLVESELERYGTGQKDAYVLCRVFHKNNIGPPSGNRYAPFIEEEWDDSGAAVVPGVDAVDEVAPGDDAYDGRNNVEQVCTSFYLISYLCFHIELYMVDLELETRDLLPMCKREREEDVTPLCVLNTQAPFPLLQYKRRRHNDSSSSHSNASGNSTRTTQDLCSSTTTTAAKTATTTISTSMASATTTAVSALLEFSLMESLEPIERPHVRQPTFDATNLDLSVSPSIQKFLNDLQKELHKVSVERETLKLEMMSAHAMINILQSRIDFLNKENENLKRNL